MACPYLKESYLRAGSIITQLLTNTKNGNITGPNLIKLALLVLVYACVYKCVFMLMCLHICGYVCVCVCMFVFMYAFMHVCVCVCLYMCLCLCICEYTCNRTSTCDKRSFSNIFIEDVNNNSTFVIMVMVMVG